LDDLPVIRFVAMDIFTASGYHASLLKKSPFFFRADSNPKRVAIHSCDDLLSKANKKGSSLKSCPFPSPGEGRRNCPA